ncbi:MAG TPA: phosphoribosyltransferase [Acidimicrobiia bacterium]|nr:phosphoribosyltransferase [Acidimicrobiia bacterium]
MAERYTDREDAGKKLAVALQKYQGQKDVVVFGLPRGGVPVAFEVARQLKAPLDILVVRKIGVPGQPELAMGAVASGGVVIRNEQVIRAAGVGSDRFDAAVGAARDELTERDAALRGAELSVDLTDKTVIVVDDGMATGSTMLAAVEALRTMQPERIVIAVPVGAPEVVDQMGAIADDVVCLLTPRNLVAVGSWYRHFGQTTEMEVRRLLDASARP